MKEELKKIRDIAKELPEKIESFNLAVTDFEAKVHENSKLTSMLDYYLLAQDCECYFEAAMLFYEENPALYDAAARLKAQHPRYQDKSIKKNLFEMLNDGYDLDELGADIELYIGLKNIGFEELIGQQEEIVGLEERSGLLKTVVVQETKDKVVNTGKKVVNSIYSIARPYGEVARDQISTAGDKAKDAVHNGSKKLARLFDSIAEKVSSEE